MSYGMKNNSADWLAALAPLSGLRRTAPCSGSRIGRSMLSCGDMAPWLSTHSPTTKWGEGGGASHQRGNAGVVHEVYDSLFFSSNFLFPLEGKCHVVAKGCTGQSNDVILYRYPDRQSAASLATSWSSPPCKQVALVLISAVVKFFHKRAPSINLEAPPQPSPLKGKRLTMICASLCSFKSCSLCTPKARQT